jgi:hypothetical protein
MLLNIIGFIKPLIRSLEKKTLDNPRNSPNATTAKTVKTLHYTPAGMLCTNLIR